MKFSERTERPVSSLAVLLGVFLGMAWSGYAFTDYGCAPAKEILQEVDEELLRELKVSLTPLTELAGSKQPHEMT